MKVFKSFVVLAGWVALAVAAVFGNVEGAANVLAFGAGFYGLLYPFMLTKDSIAKASPEDAKPMLPGWVTGPLWAALIGTLAWGGLTWTAVGFTVAFLCRSVYRAQVAKREAEKGNQ
jgi:hypothetical protein